MEGLKEKRMRKAEITQELHKNHQRKSRQITQRSQSTHFNNLGKQNETLIATYKAITRPVIEYGNTLWSPIISYTNLNKLQATQNTALRIITGCTADTNIQHLHTETEILPLSIHLKLHASQDKNLNFLHILFIHLQSKTQVADK